MRPLQTVTTCLAAAAIFAVGAGLTARAAEGENAPAKPKHHAGGMTENFVRPMVVNQLSLTADQQTKYNDLLAQYQQDAAKWTKDHNFDAQKWRQEIQAARQAKDKAKVKELMAEHQPLVELASQSRDKFKALLTDEQKKKFTELMTPPMGRRAGAAHEKAGEQPPAPAPAPAPAPQQ